MVRRAITESCGKYCDVLLQVAQDLPPPVLAELKRKAVTALDGHSQELFSGALAAAFGADSGNGAGPGAAGRIAQSSPTSSPRCQSLSPRSFERLRTARTRRRVAPRRRGRLRGWC